jgi:hypothetical protein
LSLFGFALTRLAGGERLASGIQQHELDHALRRAAQDLEGDTPPHGMPGQQKTGGGTGEYLFRHGGQGIERPVICDPAIETIAKRGDLISPYPFVAQQARQEQQCRLQEPGPLLAMSACMTLL